MASNVLHTAYDSAAEGSLPAINNANTLRKDPPSTRSQQSNKARLVKSRVASGTDDFSAAATPVTAVEQSSSNNNRNRLRKGPFGNNVSSLDTDYGPRPPPMPGAYPSPSISPSIPKNQLATSTATTAQSSSARPAPLRTQSYSKRHASFDTPREIPLPTMPSGQDPSTRMSTFDDSERENEVNRHQQQLSRPPAAARRSTGEADLFLSTAELQQQAPPITAPPDASQSQSQSHSLVEDRGSHFPHLPQFSRNNSAPTPPHTPGAERVDLRPRNQPSSDFMSSLPEHSSSSSSSSSSGTNSPGNATESDDTPSASESPVNGGDATADQRTGNRGDEKGIHMVTADSRLSTTSLPLPHAYGAERVSRLPPTSRPGPANASSTHASIPPASQSPFTPPEAQSVQNVASETHDTSTTDQQHQQSTSTMGYRASYPLTSPIAREVTLNSLPSQLLENATPGTAFRFSAASLRQFSVVDDDEREAIKRGHTPKLPEIEAPKSVLHPLLSTQGSLATVKGSLGAKPTAASSSSSERLLSNASPPERVEAVNPLPSRDSTSPAMSANTDRASTASGSSGVGSEYSSQTQPAPDPRPRMQSAQPASSRLIHPRPVTAPEVDRLQMNPNSPSTLPGQASQSLPDPNTIQREGTNGPVMTVDTTPSAYILQASLSGYQRDEITISTRKKRILHVVADGFVSGGGHFERRISFGYDADMTRVRAEFNGSVLKITVPRRPTPQSFAASLSSSASATGGQAFGTGGTSMFWRGRSNML